MDNVHVETLREPFQAWLHRLPGYEEARIGDIAPVEGGASNLTYRVALEGGPAEAICLRVQRKEGIFQPYNVVREAEVLRRLAASPIPVPAVLGIEWDNEVLGARFIVLEWVNAPHMGEAGAEADFGAFTRMVAAIHGLDYRAYGLEFLGVPLDHINAILSELAPIARRMRAFELDDDPLLKRALAALQSRRPGAGRITLCQGDINVFNYLFRNREVVAVVDWEQAHIGDPRSDIGQLLALSNLKGAPFQDVRAMPFLQAYEAAAVVTLEDMEYFRALWFFQLTVIHHAWVRLNGSLPWFSLLDVTGFLEQSLDRF